MRVTPHLHIFLCKLHYDFLLCGGASCNAQRPLQSCHVASPRSLWSSLQPKPAPSALRPVSRCLHCSGPGRFGKTTLALSLASDWLVADLIRTPVAWPLTWKKCAPRHPWSVFGKKAQGAKKQHPACIYIVMLGPHVILLGKLEAAQAQRPAATSIWFELDE